ncbi:hypothetical protein NliqN6_5491 [Naganishia liquefaciens]|uniref:Major facilitator superfamily (MFS) profile domain-containing protein n=1 Tax=Naganishia liquefaciens TaxID=104408 RepID=A0A8H3TZL7_9TREE|nr:hypothetical protein NliqN6_5491 [Naganishia liquefaciens]
MSEIKSAPSKVETAHYESYNDGRYPDNTEKGISTTVEDSDVSDNNQVHNVLAHYSKEELLADVDRFAAQHGLEHAIDDLRKGALLAQRPQHYMSIPELNDDDRAVITQERNHRWKHPMTLYWTIFVCSVGAATQGWDQTGSNGANLSFPTEFGIAGKGGDEWLVGLVNAAPYIASALCGAWLSDPLNNILGRRGVIFLTALCLIATPIGSGFTQSWQGLFVCRLVLGLGMGAKGSTVPIFAAENSPAAIRGALVMSWQLWTAFGIFLGFAANVIVQDTGAIAWRLQLGSAFIPAVPLAVGIWFTPESPRWLLKKGRHAKAYKSLLRLRFTPLQAARDLYYISAQLDEEAKILRADNFFRRFQELFVIPRVKRATWAAFTVMLAQQMCGINIIAFYSSTIFAENGFTSRQALYASLGFGAVNFVFAFPALFTIDTYGRRSLLLFTFPIMAVFLLAGGLCFLIPEETHKTAKVGLVALFVYLFAAAYSPGEGPVPFTYSAEVFPLAQREIGMAFAVSVCLGFSAILSITFPAMLAALGSTGSFCFYAGLNMIAFVMIFHLVPETKALTLEELDYVFSVPSSTFIKYQYKYALPYWIKRWIFWQRNVRLQPMVVLDDSVEVIKRKGGGNNAHN